MAAVRVSFRLGRSLLSALAAAQRKRFIEACRNPQPHQRAILERVLANATTPFPSTPVRYEFYADRTRLTKERVLFREFTSGTGGAKKSIPYTKSFVRTFEAMFLLWAHDLLLHSGIPFKSGKFFMSISPLIGGKNTDDRKYLSPLLSTLLNPFLVSNPVLSAASGDEFLLRIAGDMRRSTDLEIISVWSPTYLLSVIDFMEKNRVALGITGKVQDLWPELKLISCWTHAQAQTSANRLRELFPNVVMQPKGLLLTEGAITIPWVQAGGCVPLVTDVYVEFYHSQLGFVPMHDLKVAERYSIVTSQMNGYLRYDTQDEVVVTGFYHKVPVLEFTGRSGQYSDLAGEKFSEELLRATFADLKPLLLVPDQREVIPGYVAVTASDADEVEARLRRIHHYHLARELNQLRKVRVVPREDVPGTYYNFCQVDGMIWGEIKERVLIHDPKAAERFLAWLEKEVPSSR